MSDVHTPEGKRELLGAIVMDLNSALAKAVEEMPDDWDGRHLRVLLLDLVKSEVEGWNVIEPFIPVVRRHPSYQKIRDVARF